MKNFLARGDVLTFTAAAALASGQGLLQGATFGVVANSAASGEDAVLNLTGVYELPKAGSQAWAFGAAVYWDDTAKVCTTTATGNTKIGIAAAPVTGAAGNTLGRVRLNGSF